MKKAKIQEFNPQIYPIKFWVCLNATPENISDVFEFKGESEELITAIDKNLASTSIVIRKSDGTKGALVFSKKLSYITGSTIAHESVHVADIYFQELGMMSQTFDCGNEPYAYLVGWIAKCINQARLGVNNTPVNTL